MPPLGENGKVLVRGGIISFDNIYRRYYKPDEEIYLLKYEYTKDKDEFGKAKKQWNTIKKIEGLIQSVQFIEIDKKGTESEARYEGYFKPDPALLIKSEEVNDYRIKWVRPFETVVYKIRRYNPNLWLKPQDHVQLRLMRDKKWPRE